MEQEKFKFRWFELLQTFIDQALHNYNRVCEVTGEKSHKVSSEEGITLFVEHFLAEYCGGDEEKMVCYHNLGLETIFPAHFLLNLFHQLLAERIVEIVEREGQTLSARLVIKTACGVVFECFNPECEGRDQVISERMKRGEAGIEQPESIAVPIAEDFSFVLWIDKSSMANFLQALWNVREHFNQLRSPFSEMAAELAASNN